VHPRHVQKKPPPNQPRYKKGWSKAQQARLNKQGSTSKAQQAGLNKQGST